MIIFIMMVLGTTAINDTEKEIQKYAESESDVILLNFTRIEELKESFKDELKATMTVRVLKHKDGKRQLEVGIGVLIGEDENSLYLAISKNVLKDSMYIEVIVESGLYVNASKEVILSEKKSSFDVLVLDKKRVTLNYLENLKVLEIKNKEDASLNLDIILIKSGEGDSIELIESKITNIEKNEDRIVYYKIAKNNKLDTTYMAFNKNGEMIGVLEDDNEDKKIIPIKEIVYYYNDVLRD